MLLTLLASVVFFHDVNTNCHPGSALAWQKFLPPLRGKIEDQRVLTIPGDAALLNCTLASPNVFDIHSTPYNISWFEGNTSRELSDGVGQFRVRETMLWILNSTLEDAGQYACILSTPDKCFKQTTVLEVRPPGAGGCGQPDVAKQILTELANGVLVCPLLAYMSQVDSYSFQWYKECDLIQEGPKFSLNRHRLRLRHVVGSDSGLYTCRMTFNLTGTIGHRSETIECTIKEEWNLQPIVYQPINEVVKAGYGGPFNKTCQVFVPSKGNLSVDVSWASEEDFISKNRSERVHQVHLSRQKVDDGERLEVLLNFTEVTKNDFNQNYTCMVFSDKGVVTSEFVLQPSDPDAMIPLGLVFVGLALTFLICVTAYKIFKIDIVLWCRSSFPYLYKSTGSDGKVYDAYVVYPRMCWNRFHGSAETFVIHTLPQVLEKKCGYKLFIYCRDSLPGEAVVDSVQDNISKSRCLILVYTASTFSELGSTFRFEQELGMHTTLVEGTLQVILVELEEVKDYSLFPKSVLHLRSKQGAAQWWKMANKVAGHPQLCPSSRFWKQVRYGMPVKSIPASSSQNHGCWTGKGP